MMTKYPTLADYTTLEIPVKVIYFDQEFNCRGEFTPQSCIELADSMRTKGLKIPIMVQPSADATGVPVGFEYRIVAGHRRFTAAKLLLQWVAIPATVITGLSEDDARIINLAENLERKNLTMYQEAVALRHTFPMPLSFEKMATIVNKSSTWCRMRWRLLDSPEEIIELARKEIIGPDDLHQLSYKSHDEQRAVAEEIRVAGLHGETLAQYKRRRMVKRKSRNVRDIDEMLTTLMARGLSPDPYKVLTWAAGRITDDELLS